MATRFIQPRLDKESQRSSSFEAPLTWHLQSHMDFAVVLSSTGEVVGSYRAPASKITLDEKTLSFERLYIDGKWTPVQDWAQHANHSSWIPAKICRASREMADVELLCLRLRTATKDALTLLLVRLCTLEDILLQDHSTAYRSLLDHNPNAVFSLAVDGRLTSINKTGIVISGFSEAELVGTHFNELIYAEDRPFAAEEFEKVLLGHARNFDLRVHHKNGRVLQLQVVCVPVQKDGQVTGAYCLASDVTPQRHVFRLVYDQNRILEQVVAGVALPSLVETIESAVQSFFPCTSCRISFASQRASGHSAGFTWTRPIRLSDGTIWGHFDFSQPEEWAITQSDIEILESYTRVAEVALDRWMREQENHYLAYNDPLTGLPNRRSFQEHLQSVLNMVNGENQSVAIMYLDLDRFKPINDSLGHTVGDQVLVEMARRFERVLSGQGLVARMGGDEFSVLLAEEPTREQLTKITRDLQQATQEPITMGNYTFYLTASVGISIFPEHGEDATTLLKNADSALYWCKDRGRNRSRIYEHELSVASYQELELLNDFERALCNHEFRVYYQPRLSLTSGQFVGAEALIRWLHPERGLIPPGDFINVAEETGLIIRLGEWVLRNVCEQLGDWKRRGLPVFPTAVNVSGKQLLEPNFATKVANILAESGMAPELIELELTETTLMNPEESVLETIRDLKNQGIRIAIDDFGTGYSSFAMLRQFPMDALKIDQSFTRDMTEQGRSIVKTMVNLGQSMRMRVVAEGVESLDQCQELLNSDCDELQGYLVSPPLPPDEFQSFVANPSPVDISVLRASQ